MVFLFILLMIMQVCITTGTYRGDAENLYRNFLNGNSFKIRPYASVNVTIGLTVLSTNLDSNEETITVSGRLTVIWREEGWELSTYPVDVFHLKEGEIWRPELVIENMLDDIGVIADENLIYRIHHTGIITWEPAVNAKVHCPHDFTYYPFDKQTCAITVSCWSYDHSETALQALRSQVNLNVYEENSDFRIEETSVETSQATETHATVTRTYSKLTFYMTYRRHTQFFGLTLLLPLVLLSALASLTFILPPETGEKANCGVTVLLIIVIFYTVVSAYTPVFKGVCVIVVYAAIVLILATFAILCNLVVLYLYHQDKHREMKPSVRSVLRILMRITCRHGPTDDVKSVVLSEETTSSRLSDHDLNACSTLPNGGIGEKKPGRLSPINRRVVPSETIADSEAVTGDRLTRRESLSRLDTETNQAARNIEDLMKVTELQTVKKIQLKDSLNLRAPWQEMSACLDRLFLVVFIILSFIIHLIFLSVLGSGSG